MRRGKNLLVHLVNTSGPHREQSLVETIRPVGPVEVVLRLGGRPDRVTLEPEHRDLSVEYHDGQARVAVPAVAIHCAIVVEMPEAR
jgi:hypothetical protein